MQRLTVELPDEQMKALERLATRDGRTVSELVAQAVQRLLDQQQRRHTAAREQLREVVEEIWSKVPKDIPPEEIEADITAAFNEVRAGSRRAPGVSVIP